VRKLCGEYPVGLICRVLGLPRSSFYYRQKENPQELELIDQIESIAAEYPRYGYRRITAELRRRGYHVNHRKVLRIMGQNNLLVQVKRFCRTTVPGEGGYPNLIRDLVIDRPNQVWCGDITYIRLGNGFVYLAVLMDVYTRAIRGWELSQGLMRSLP